MNNFLFTKWFKYLAYPFIILLIAMLFAYITYALKLNYFLGQISGLISGQFVFSFLIIKNKWYENLTAGLVVAALLIVLFILTDELMRIIITDNNPHHEKYYEWIIIGVPIIISILFWEIILSIFRKDKIKTDILS